MGPQLRGWATPPERTRKPRGLERLKAHTGLRTQATPSARVVHRTSSRGPGGPQQSWPTPIKGWGACRPYGRWTPYWLGLASASPATQGAGTLKEPLPCPGPGLWGGSHNTRSPRSPAVTQGPHCHSVCRRWTRGSSVLHTDEFGS